MMFFSSLTKSFKCLSTGGSISNMLSNGYIARYNTKANVFFNRTRELRYFRNAFSNEQPRLHVILGPPSTGKTALIREITTKNENFSPLFINCRNGQFDSPENVYNSLSIQFKTLADKQMKYLEKLPNELEIKDKILDFVNFVAEKGKEKITSDRVSELLSKIVGTLRIGTFGMVIEYHNLFWLLMKQTCLANLVTVRRKGHPFSNHFLTGYKRRKTLSCYSYLFRFIFY